MAIVGDIARVLSVPVGLETTRPNPGPMPSDDEAREALMQAFAEKNAERGLAPVDVTVSKRYPPGGSRETRVRNYLNKPEGYPSLLEFASATPYEGTNEDGSVIRKGKIKINPNVDRSFFAHELGHLASRQKGFGRQVSDARNLINKNPMLKRALTTAIQLGPLAASALIPGSDDLLTALAVGLAPSMATYADEAMASMHGLDIMKRAGMPATLGQRGRLAGAFMTYANPALIYSIGGNVLGNLADDEIARQLYGSEDS